MACHTHPPPPPPPRYDIPPDEPGNDTFASEEVTASDTTREHRPNAFTGNDEIERQDRGSSDTESCNEFESSRGSEELDYKNGFFTEKAHDGLQSTPTNAPDFKPYSKIFHSGSWKRQEKMIISMRHRSYTARTC